MPGGKFIRNSEWGISLLAGCEVGSLVLVGFCSPLMLQFDGYRGRDALVASTGDPDLYLCATASSMRQELQLPKQEN